MLNDSQLFENSGNSVLLCPGIFCWHWRSNYKKYYTLLVCPIRVAKCCNKYVCVCLSLSRITWKLHDWTLPIFYACCLWPWIGPPLMALWYVMYFRLYGWRHFFIPWDLQADGRTRHCVARWYQWTWPLAQCEPLRPTAGSLAQQAGLLVLVGRAGRWLSSSWTRLLPGWWCAFRHVLHVSSELRTVAMSAIHECLVIKWRVNILNCIVHILNV